jgi:hypothetical protein
MILPFCRIQYLPHLPGQSFIRLMAQSLLRDVDPRILAQLMSSHATLDPAPIRPVSDKRKAPSLIASSTVKKKRTSKKLVIQVRTPSPPEHNAILHSNHLYLCMILDQNTATSGYYRFCQCFINW